MEESGREGRETILVSGEGYREERREGRGKSRSESERRRYGEKEEEEARNCWSQGTSQGAFILIIREMFT